MSKSPSTLVPNPKSAPSNELPVEGLREEEGRATSNLLLHKDQGAAQLAYPVGPKSSGKLE